MLTIEKAPPRGNAARAINFGKLTTFPTKNTGTAQYLRVVRSAKLTALQARALVRLREMLALRQLHRCNGIVDPIEPWARVVIDALAELSGFQHWALDRRMLRTYLPGNVDDVEADRLLDLPRRDGRLLSNARAGQMLGFTLIEHQAIVADVGLVTTLAPIDEDPAARTLRRAKRRKEKDRERKRRAKMRKGECNPGHIHRSASYINNISNNQDAEISNVSLRDGKGPTQILDAVKAGCDCAAQIIEKTGLGKSAVKVGLTRLCEKGLLQKTAPGRYAVNSRPKVSEYVAKALASALRNPPKPLTTRLTDLLLEYDRSQSRAITVHVALGKNVVPFPNHQKNASNGW